MFSVVTQAFLCVLCPSASPGDESAKAGDLCGEMTF